VAESLKMFCADSMMRDSQQLLTLAMRERGKVRPCPVCCGVPVLAVGSDGEGNASER
jgi:hypothetical protein